LKNLEIKAKCIDFNGIKQVLINIRAKYKGVLNQTDTYFPVKQGRLKMRVINSKQYELIYYYRANRKSERYSNYEIVNIINGKEMLSLLSRSLNLLCVVRKKRELYIYENVRIHLDTVQNLGRFIEFEIVCNSKKDEKEAFGKMRYLKKVFNIGEKSLIQYSYGDLVISNN